MRSAVLANLQAGTSSPAVFIDRNSGGITFREELIAYGIRVVLHDEVFKDRTTPDPDWLKALEGKGFIVVTGDKATTRSPLFLERLKRSTTYVFVLLGLNGLSPSGKAQCIKSAYPIMVQLMGTRPPPALWKIGGENNSKVQWCDHLKILGKSHASGRA